MKKEEQKLLHAIAQAIYDKKAKNVIALDVRGICTMTDFFLIAEGTVERHVNALSDIVIEAMDKQGYAPIHVDGQPGGDWVVIDFGTIVVHIFVPELRDKYRLEELWGAGDLVELDVQ